MTELVIIVVGVALAPTRKLPAELPPTEALACEQLRKLDNSFASESGAAAAED